MIFVILLALALALIPSITLATTVSYDTRYDNGGSSLTSVACSDGANGLITRGFNTFKDLPSFPHIGGAQAVAGWNSPNCGTCWQLAYTNAQGMTNTINVLAIDVAQSGSNIALSAMNELTGGNAAQLGRIDVVSLQVNASVCGL
jgi:Cerato-platanin